jgi:hypothetical protein
MRVRIAAITFILACTSAAWFILAATIEHRTYQSDDRLRPGVASVWGSPQEQRPPSASYEMVGPTATIHLPLESSRINVGLNLDYRQKGLLWYSTYVVDFDGQYAFRNPADGPQNHQFLGQFSRRARHV